MGVKSRTLPPQPGGGDFGRKLRCEGRREPLEGRRKLVRNTRDSQLMLV